MEKGPKPFIGAPFLFAAIAHDLALPYSPSCVHLVVVDRLIVTNHFQSSHVQCIIIRSGRIQTTWRRVDGGVQVFPKIGPWPLCKLLGVRSGGPA
jgi:hypothetical protein